MARQINSWLQKGTQRWDYRTGKLKEWETRVEVRMKPEENSQKVKTEPSGKGKLGKGDGRNWEKTQKGKKHRKEKTPELGSEQGGKQVPQKPKSH